MAPTTRKSVPVPSETPLAHQAADQLWKFQLRKEHGQLKEQLSAAATDTQKMFEKIHAKLNAVEEKVDKFGIELKKLGQEGSKMRGEIQALKEKVGSIEKNAERPKHSITSNISKNQEKSSNLRRQTLRSSAETTKKNADTSLTLPSSDPVPYSSSDETDDLSVPRTKISTIPKTRGRVAKRKLVSSDPVDIPAAEPLRQGASNLKDYLLLADRRLADLPQPTSARAESEFVKSFLDGLTHHTDRKALVITLQLQEGLTTITTSSSGKRDIMVRWSDLKEAVVRSKLLEVTNVMKSRDVVKPVDLGKKPLEVTNVRDVTKVTKQQGPKRKKRRLITSDDD